MITLTPIVSLLKLYQSRTHLLSSQLALISWYWSYNQANWQLKVVRLIFPFYVVYCQSLKEKTCWLYGGPFHKLGMYPLTNWVGHLDKVVMPQKALDSGSWTKFVFKGDYDR